MEEHRLKEMSDDYDVALFNELYKKTAALRKKLAYEIDARKFGLETKDIQSWFDVKFIFTFQKYQGKMGPDLLKGYLINALRMFRYRIMKTSYSGTMELHNTVDITELYDYENLMIENQGSAQELFLNVALEFMEKNLSQEAYLLLKLQLNPPEYILSRMKKKNSPIPAKLLAEYFGEDLTSEAQSHFNNLLKEIERITTKAKEYFRNRELSFA